MKKLRFLFCVHGHLLPGSSQELYDQAYQDAYLPFIRVLQAHPKIKINLHFSGTLFDWLVRGHQGYLDLIIDMIKTGQIELLGGAYNEPILPLVPDHDKIGQIKMMNSFLKKNFGVAPRGAWLPSNIWEPSLAKPLAKSGIDFTVLDESYFTAAKVGDSLNGCFLTEEQGYKLNLFPSDEILWTLIPFKKPNEAIDYLQDLALDQPGQMVCLATALENFGLVPNSNKWVYQEKYLDRLFSLFEKNSSWLEMTTFSDYLDQFPPRGKVYLPSPVDEKGYYRNFLIDPQALAIHNKAYMISSRLRSLKKGRTLVGDQKKDHNIRIAEVELYRGQALGQDVSNPKMRREIYSNLIKAERALELHSRGEVPFVDVLVSDLNNDGQEEIVLSNNLVNLFFSPSSGGELYEIDYKPKAVNLVDLKTSCGGFSLIDRFLDKETDLIKFRSLGPEKRSAYKFMPRRGSNEISLLMKRETRVNEQKVALSKKITLCPNQSIFTIEYDLENLSDEVLETNFGIEFGLSLGVLEPSKAYYQFVGKDVSDSGLQMSGVVNDIQQWKLIDACLGVSVSFDSEKQANLWVFPVKPDAGFQGSEIFPNWDLKLAPNEKWKNRLVFRIEE